MRTTHYVTHSLPQYRTGFGAASQIAHEVNLAVRNRMPDPTPEALREELNRQVDIELQSIYGLRICSVTSLN